MSISVETSPGRFVQFTGDSLETIQQEMSNWLTDGPKDMVAFSMHDDEGDWLVCLVHTASDTGPGEWHIVDAPPGIASKYMNFEDARDQFVDLAGTHAIELLPKKEHLLCEIMLVSVDE
jgi:hypothetical protein